MPAQDASWGSPTLTLRSTGMRRSSQARQATTNHFAADRITPGMTHRTAVALLLLALTALTGCGDEVRPSRPASTAPAGGQATFAAADPRVPDGYQEELCPDLRGDSSGLALRLVVPADYAGRTEKSGPGCYFQA